jgi:hypothetical protein
MPALEEPPIGSVLAVSGAMITAALNDDAFAGARPVVVGDLLGMPAGPDRAFGIVHSLRKGRRAEDGPIAEIHLLGELVHRAGMPVFRRGLSAYPALDAPLARATRAETAVVYAQPSVPHVKVGQLRRDPDIPAYLLADSLLGKHFAVLGSTGSGKSCAVTVILRSLLSSFPYAHVVLIDPHGEYGAAFGDQALALDAGSLELPYWLLNQEEAASILTSGDTARAYAESAILRDAILRAKYTYLGVDPDSQAVTVDGCRRGCGGNWLSVISRAGRVVGSGGEVNRERCGRLGEALPSIDLAHGDLA